MSGTRTHPEAEPTLWPGLVVFSGMMLLILGGFQAIEGIVAIARDEYFATTSDGLVITVDYTVWGWTHLSLGVITIAAGFGVFFGKTWARVVGIIVAGVSALGNLLFLPAYPVWCTIIIATCVLVIYSLAVHGREVR
ncbi:hypothetical protein ACTI_39980 [Actinoplanes sp. OR16]|uniref:DUF7144 family membrane protein n=1 Tax=Actinoplanes sp. OR16 TaxID=946334 RepID=UPI000F703010|nr:hypothetical protein [Actinoplanes sp. OR16]BBH67313.1 hypothetical protein ACTI_39980 [Actinoplanes sp. OR16]